ncbi:hypothetical protein [Undibacterium seohonense]|nr:hypothetical protein [Undibacterium seohonense]
MIPHWLRYCDRTDVFGVASAMWFVAALTFLSGVIAAVRMRSSV